LRRRNGVKFENDDRMFTVMRQELYTAVCCDVMDRMGFRDQAMRHDIRPIDETMVVLGRAKTVLAVDVYEVYDDPYTGEIAALDSVKPGEVVVASTNQSIHNCLFGELLSTATRMRGGTGAVIDGLIRDVRQIKAMGFPMFAVGYKPLDSAGRGKVIDWDCPIVCGDVRVQAGDIIFGDIDGLVVIPKAIAAEVIETAQQKVHKENLTRDELLKGSLLGEVYKKYGVL
jgi:4-hydroxy-4-methyl-2-oxoglutarate aldolase